MQCYARFKNGFEPKVQENLASHLLDIDGDSCHHVHNIAKCFTKPFKNFWKVYLAIFALILITAVILAILTSICDVLSLQYIKSTNFASCRWLSAFLPMTSKKAKIEELQTSIASKWQASTNKRRERKSQMSKKLKKIFLIYQFINVFSKYLRITQCFLSVMNPLFIKYMQSSTSL